MQSTVYNLIFYFSLIHKLSSTSSINETEKCIDCANNTRFFNTYVIHEYIIIFQRWYPVRARGVVERFRHRRFQVLH